MHVVIIGNGIAGATVARHVRALAPEARITMIGLETRLPWSRPALMYVYMGHLRFEDTETHPASFWRDNRIELVPERIVGVDVERRTLRCETLPPIHWDRLVLATGSRGRRLGWPGQDLHRVSTMVDIPDLQALERWTRQIRHAVIVGGGLIGVELAEMLHSRGRTVTMLIREPRYWAHGLPAEESALVADVLRAAGVDLRFSTELAEIQGDGTGAVAGVRTTAGDTLPCDYVGLTVGVEPRIDLCHGTPIAASNGVLVDDRLRTSVPDVFAVGDCAEVRRSDGTTRVGSTWYTARMQAEIAAKNVCGGDVAWDPGVWFNSAKFFDVEHQVYGDVPPSDEPGVDHVFWRDDAGRRSVRIAHRGGRVQGFLTLGVRLRHRVCERWIQDRTPLDHVLRDLSEACFDPELSRRVESHVRAAAGA